MYACMYKKNFRPVYSGCHLGPNASQVTLYATLCEWQQGDQICRLLCNGILYIGRFSKTAEVAQIFGFTFTTVKYI
jgi:hypothetical protein